MRLMRVAFALGACLWLGALPALAQDDDATSEIALPGLQSDAEAFAAKLKQAFPAGATDDQKQQASDAANAALHSGDMAKALLALETLIGAEGDQASWQNWLALAKAETGVSPPRPGRALQAAWLAFTMIDRGSDTAAQDQVSALNVMDAALLALKQPVPELEVLQAIARREPGNPAAQQAAVRVQQQVGLAFRRLSTDAEAFPTRACIGFLGNPSSAPDFHPADWVTLAPPQKDAAVTLESRRICVTGLPPGATTKVTFAHGMPGDGGVSLHQDLAVPVAMPDRQPRLVFDNGRYIQPRGAAATVALETVNLSAVKLTLVRVAERSLVTVMQSYPPGQLLDSYAGTNLAENQGKVVWTGSASVPGFTRNALEHVVLPLPPVMTQSGLYALVVGPGDGTPFPDGSAPGAVQMILRTDLAPTIWHGTDGDTIQLRSYATGLPVASATIDVIAADNEILATDTTDADGVAHVAQPLLAGQNGLAPVALHIRGTDGDFTRLGLTSPDFDLSDRGVAGNAQPGPIDPFIWTDRGIYRPGETVHVMALIRDGAGAPVDLPLHLIVTRADGRVYQDTVPPRAADDSLASDVTLSSGAPLGSWTIALATDPKGPAIASQTFTVDAFVPPRLAVTFPNPPRILAPGAVTNLPVAARFLYGAPGSGLSGSGSVTFALNPTPFPAFADYRFGLADENFASKQTQLDMAETDEQGRTVLPVDLSTLPDTSGALEAQLSATVNDPAGRGVEADTTIPVRPATPLIGIAEDFAGDSVNEGAPAGFRIIAVGPDGQRVGMPVQIRLVRQEPDWRLVVNNGQASYETVWQDEPVDSRGRDPTRHWRRLRHQPRLALRALPAAGATGEWRARRYLGNLLLGLGGGRQSGCSRPCLRACRSEDLPARRYRDDPCRSAICRSGDRARHDRPGEAPH